MYLDFPKLEKVSRFWWINYGEKRTICEVRDGMVHFIGHAEPAHYDWDGLRNVEWLGPIDNLIDWINKDDCVSNYQMEFFQTDYKSWKHLLRQGVQVKYESHGHIKPGKVYGFAVGKDEVVLIVPDETFKVIVPMKDILEIEDVCLVFRQNEYLSWEPYLKPKTHVVWKSANGKWGAKIVSGGNGNYVLELDHTGERTDLGYIENIVEVHGVKFR